MWQNIPWQGVEYFATSYIISMSQTNILGIFHDVAWNIFKDSFLLMWTFSLVHLLTSLFQAKERELNKLQLEIIMLNQNKGNLE
jgi:hypothetical protein